MSSSNFPNDLAISPSVRPHFISDTPNDTPFSSSAQKETIKEYGIAGRVWEAAYAMDFYVQNPPFMDFDPPFALLPDHPATILELGSGTGMVGSRIAAKLPEPGRDLVIVTDLPEVCPLLTANLTGQLNKDRTRILVRPLPWGDSEHALRLASELFPGNDGRSRFLTHIICSDLIYFPDLFPPLLRTLIQLSSLPFIPSSDHQTLVPEPLVLISYKVRSLTKETSFWSAFGLWFTFEPVLVRAQSSNNGPCDGWTRLGAHDGPTFVFAARRRPSSFDWKVPESDQELMSGVGAWGNDARKGDDTFETLLLMSISIEEAV